MIAEGGGMTKRLSGLLAALVISSSWAGAAPLAAAVTVRLGPSAGAQPLDGRLLLLISKDAAGEPRFQINDGPSTQQVFGIDVEGWKTAQPMTFDGDVLGYPLVSLREVPAGEYTVQALLHKYETFRRADGHVLKLPMDRGEG